MWSDSVVDPGLWNGTAWLDSGTFTAWRTPGPSLLGGLRDLDRNWTGESDRCGRTHVSESDRCGRTQLWIRDFHCLADSGTFTAWRNSGPGLLGGLHWNWNGPRQYSVLRESSTSLPKLLHGWARFLGVSSTGVHLGTG